MNRALISLAVEWACIEIGRASRERRLIAGWVAAQKP